MITTLSVVAAPAVVAQPLTVPISRVVSGIRTALAAVGPSAVRFEAGPDVLLSGSARVRLHEHRPENSLGAPTEMRRSFVDAGPPSLSEVIVGVTERNENVAVAPLEVEAEVGEGWTALSFELQAIANLPLWNLECFVNLQQLRRIPQRPLPQQD